MRSLSVMNLETGKTVTVDSPASGAKDTKETKDPKEDTKPAVRWGMPLLSDDGALAVAHVRAANNKDRWLVAVDPETGKVRVLDTLHDDAWVREVGGFGAVDPSFGLLPDQKHLWFLSERDGWMHLYSARCHRAAAGRASADAGQVGDRRRRACPRTRRSSTSRAPRCIRASGTSMRCRLRAAIATKLTSMTGGTTGEASPDDRTFGLIYSSSTKPNEVYVMPNRAGAAATQVTTSTSEEWRSFKWVEPQLVTYKTRDGVDVYARLFTPEMVGAKRDPAAPAVVFVHGAGYLQNAHKYWSTYYREYMFHNLLASRGYVVLDPDYRASAGYGRDWRTAIYRHMGGKDLDDVVDGAKYLVDKQKVNAKRIGVYGGSYGGFITLMAMFTTPDVFAAGAALRPVTDWTHYNHGYTSNILNEPQADAEAYRKSSPIYFAEGLKGALLICHGMVDTNVLFQDSVRLVQRLIELRKENWSVAPFPVENHGFEEDASWADEYKRILKLFEDNLRPHDTRRAS